MTKVNPFMRLKVKADTFFLPDPNGSVYFRNNIGSFRMEGDTIEQWIEKLLPMFNGEHTLEDLTDGLPAPYQQRVYEIAESLYQNGFVRDVNQDRPHQLSEAVLNKYESQIEFLENLADSAALRFQSYRQANVLAVGSGPFFVSLVEALLESGLSKFHILITDSLPTNRQRLEELAAHARKTDPEVAIEEITLQEGVGSWREAVQPYDSIMYVSQEGDVGELKELHAVCREERKVLLPAIFVHQVGLAGPLVHPDSEGCWESAWRRVHLSALCRDPQLHTFSSTAGAMLANVIVFELFKTVTGVTDSELKNKFFLLDLETLEGSWHSFVAHPLVTGKTVAEWVDNLDLQLEQSKDRSELNGLHHYFSTLSSEESGIFQIWEEGELKQLPLAQCRVQAADPLSEGPAVLLPAMICVGLTHEEARREAGLAGIEAYVSRMVGLLVSIREPQAYVGVGAGETFGEGVCRGLQRCLADELGKLLMAQEPTVFPVQLSKVEDERCQFYLKALTTIQGAPLIGLGEEVSGFPVVWVGANDRWYGSIDVNVTFALRKALQHALQTAENQASLFTPQSQEVSSVFLNQEERVSLEIPACEDEAQKEVLKSALQVLKRNNKKLSVLNLACEPFLQEELAGVFGVLVGEEDYR